jgi:arginine decarboxylase-like protein
MLYWGRGYQFSCLPYLFASPDKTVVNSIKDVCLDKKEKPPDLISEGWE